MSEEMPLTRKLCEENKRLEMIIERIKTYCETIADTVSLNSNTSSHGDGMVDVTIAILSIIDVGGRNET